jgi:hypothetical protein
MPKAGVSWYFHLVAATACRIRCDERILPSFRNAEHTHAPAHACRTYSANGHDVTQNASPDNDTKTKHLPGGTKRRVPGFCRL